MMALGRDGQLMDMYPFKNTTCQGLITRYLCNLTTTRSDTWNPGAVYRLVKRVNRYNTYVTR